MIDGLQGGDLLILAGLPQVGKTALALNIARDIAGRSIPVGFFSMEMPVKRLGTRLISNESRKDLSAVTRRNYGREDIKIISNTGSRLSKFPIYIDDSSGLTHVMLYIKMEQMIKEKEVKVIFVDHLQLMMGTAEFKGNRRLQIEEITRNLKKYAKELDIPLVVLSHLSRSSEVQNRRPILSDLRESGMIEGDADIVMFIYNPPVEETIKSMSKLSKFYKEEEAAHIKELLIRKNRNGPTGMLYLYWEPSWTQFNSLEY